MNVVEVRNLSKNYTLSNSQLGRMRHLFTSRKNLPGEGLWALREVSFSVARGEAFGIIGANGSGKSTLLQMVAGILRPTAGSVEVHGRLSALLELGSGFSPEFTGRDNVYLNASLLGLSREETDERFAAIERFAGIGDFIGRPIRTYSTGMVLRLAFAVAAHVDPEILIVDEALAVGDIAFRQRCMRKIHDLRARGATILFVSHETSDVKALCERCLWLQNGVVQELGEADEVVARYLSAALHKEMLYKNTRHEDTRHEDTRETRGSAAITGLQVPAAVADFVDGFTKVLDGYRYGDGRAVIVGAELVDTSGQSIHAVKPVDRVALRMSFRVDAQIASPIAGFLVRNGRGENIFGSNTARENYPLPNMAAGDTANVDFHWPTPSMAPGAYRISLGVADGNIESYQMCDYIEDAVEMNIAGGAGSPGYFQLPCAGVTVHSNQRCK